MLLSAVSVLVVAQSSSEIPEGLMNNPVYLLCRKLCGRQKRSDHEAVTDRKMLPPVENRMVVFQLVNTASADETRILNCSLEKYAYICGFNATGLKIKHVCNEYHGSIMWRRWGLGRFLTC